MLSGIKSILIVLILPFVTSKVITSSRRDVNEFIVGGKEAESGQFPYMASIRTAAK